jgi:hypothetical protein
MLQFKGLFQKTFANPKVAILIGSLDKFFIKLPHLPKNIRVLINKIIPFLILIFGIIGLIASILTGFFLILAIISLDWVVIPEIIGSFALVLLDTLFLLKAFKPLRSGNAVGWIYLFWAETLEIVNFIIRVVNKETNVFLGIGVILLSFYLLFEIGQFYVYKKSGTPTSI